ncbi:MAG: TraB/GumN family protein, partial [Deltaproteobacteria bacterium]|nr:TraB/GumN family protein [Deltaproteobacteria bacterium]
MSLDKVLSPQTCDLLRHDNLSLDKVLSPQTCDLLRRYCETLGIPVFSLNKFKPSMVVLTLLGLELQKLGIDQTGVDNYFYHKATMEGKKIEHYLQTSQNEFILVGVGHLVGSDGIIDH